MSWFAWDPFSGIHPAPFSDEKWKTTMKLFLVQGARPHKNAKVRGPRPWPSWPPKNPPLSLKVARTWMLRPYRFHFCKNISCPKKFQATDLTLAHRLRCLLHVIHFQKPPMFRCDPLLVPESRPPHVPTWYTNPNVWNGMSVLSTAWGCHQPNEREGGSAHAGQ